MSLRNITILFITFFGINYINGQIITINPPFPTVNDVITVQYDATQGNGGLFGISPVYAHTGVVTQSGLPSSWSYVQGNWGQADPNVPADAQSMSLAKSYGEKYPSAASSVHLEWLVFFEHELMRQAARAENLKEREDASRKFAQLYHVRREAVRLLEAAYVREAISS